MTTRQRKQLLIFSITFFLSIVLLAILIIFFRHTPTTPITVMDTDWLISFDDVHYENVPIEQIAKQFSRKVQYGDKISTQCTLNMSEHYESPTLVLDIHYFALCIYIDTELIASYSMQDFENHRFVGKNYYYISIPENYHGKKLTIDYYYTEKEGVAYLQPPRFGDYSDLKLYFFHTYWFPLSCGLFLCVFGIYFFFTSLLFSALIPEVLGQMISSIISLDLGIWTLSTFRLLPIFINVSHVTTIDYLTYFMIVPFFFLLIAQIHKTYNKKLFWFIASVCIGVSLFLIILHFLNIAHITEYRFIYYCTGIILTGLLIGYDIDDVRRHNTSVVNLVQMIGPTVFCVFGITAFVIYLLHGFWNNAAPPNAALFVFTIGNMLFVLTRFMIYLLLLLESHPRRLEYNSLIYLAYVDALTGLANRTFFNETSEALEKSKSDYCLVSLDLNNLKFINDTLGHSTGDKLIRDCARIIKASFPSSALCCKIGGDEFIVVWENTSEARVIACLKRMQNSLDILNKREPNIQHSIAYGYAFRHEQENGTPHTIYLLADKRMYSNKQNQKAEASQKQ